METKFDKSEIALLLNLVHYEEHQLIDKYNSTDDENFKLYLDDELEFYNKLYKKLLAYYKELD